MSAEKKYVNEKHMLQYSLKEQLVHGMRVSNLAYGVAKELGMSQEFCQDMAVAGMLHDIGKELVSSELEKEEERLLVEEIHYVRLHPQAGYEILKKRGYSQRVLETVRYHHENMDGSGYPENLAGEGIPLGARIVRVCDVYAALTSDRPYRTAFDKKTAVELMIESVKDFDVKVFLAFQHYIHSREEKKIILPDIVVKSAGTDDQMMEKGDELWR
ncbi:MAG: HD domain-containing protein [Bacillota bacterium]|nr:HD domain-containing protein [Bacillota bacterium]